MTTAEAPEPLPRPLCDVRQLADAAHGGATRSATGALWKLAETDRQLDANLVHLPPDGSVGVHREPDLDVLLLVVAGDGVLGAGTGQVPQRLEPGGLQWLPHGAARSITAGPDGLSYLTVHRRRPGMQIRPTPPAAL